MIVALSWLLFVAPLIAFAKPAGILYRPLVAAGPWTVLAVIAYAVLVCTWATDAFYIAWFPAIVGGIAGLLFPLLARSRFSSYLLWAGPSVVVIFFWCVLWPSLEIMVPNFTYTYGTQSARDRSMFRIIQTIKVGDSSVELRRRYPAIFADPFSDRGGDGFSSMGGGGTTERYEFNYNISVNQKTGLVDDVSCDFHERN